MSCVGSLLAETSGWLLWSRRLGYLGLWSDPVQLFRWPSSVSFPRDMLQDKIGNHCRARLEVNECSSCFYSNSGADRSFSLWRMDLDLDQGCIQVALNLLLWPDSLQRYCLFPNRDLSRRFRGDLMFIPIASTPIPNRSGHVSHGKTTEKCWRLSSTVQPKTRSLEMSMVLCKKRRRAIQKHSTDTNTAWERLALDRCSMERSNPGLPH